MDRASRQAYIGQMTSSPNFTLLDQGGEPWTLSDQNGHAVVMLFLRGDWWPYCNGQLVSVALRHREFTEAGAVVVAIDVDSPGQHAAMIEKLNLPFPMLSDPDRDLSIAPFGLMNEDDPRGLAITATVLIGPEGDEAMRLVSRDFADRPFEDAVLHALQRLDLASVEQPPPTLGIPEPGPRAMPFNDLRTYFRGAKFGSKAIGMRTGAVEEANLFGSLMDHYMEDMATMYRIIRDSDWTSRLYRNLMSFPTGRRLPRQRVSAFDRDTTEKLYGVFYPQTRQTLRRKAFRGTPGGTPVEAFVREVPASRITGGVSRATRPVE
jgi:peroxiredoxin